VLRGVVGIVHSGMYRIAADIEVGDLYPLRIARDAVRPGAVIRSQRPRPGREPGAR
jgi:hypothetical protein